MSGSKLHDAIRATLAELILSELNAIQSTLQILPGAIREAVTPTREEIGLSIADRILERYELADMAFLQQLRDTTYEDRRRFVVNAPRCAQCHQLVGDAGSHKCKGPRQTAEPAATV